MQITNLGDAAFDPVATLVSGGPPPIGCVRDAQPGQTWTIQGSEICFPFANLTTLRGGEFFYIPSMRLIRKLADS